MAQYYDIPDTERSDDEINMLRQVCYAKEVVCVSFHVLAGIRVIMISYGLSLFT